MIFLPGSGFGPLVGPLHSVCAAERSAIAALAAATPSAPSAVVATRTALVKTTEAKTLRTASRYLMSDPDTAPGSGGKARDEGRSERRDVDEASGPYTRQAATECDAEDPGAGQEHEPGEGRLDDEGPARVTGAAQRARRRDAQRIEQLEGGAQREQRSSEGQHVGVLREQTEQRSRDRQEQHCDEATEASGERERGAKAARGRSQITRSHVAAHECRGGDRQTRRLHEREREQRDEGLARGHRGV